MGDGVLDPLIRATEAVKDGAIPARDELEACFRQRWKAGTDLRCWNGKRSDRPDCNHAGSQNIPYFAAFGLRDWEWIAANCSLEREEGDFGRERGAPGSFYYGSIVSFKAHAYHALARLRDIEVKLGNDAEAKAWHERVRAVHEAIRSNLAWDAVAAVPVALSRDAAVEAGVRREGAPKKRQPGFTPAVSGNRWTAHERGSGLVAENSHGITLSAAIADPKRFGLTKNEGALLGLAAEGDRDAARLVAGWMFGTIDTPDVAWRFRLRRTTLGAESIFFGPWPSPYKPPCAASQVTLDGARLIVKASPRGKQNGTVGDYEVTVDGGRIRASTSVGESEIPELAGDELWRVEVTGKKVEFS